MFANICWLVRVGRSNRLRAATNGVLELRDSAAVFSREDDQRDVGRLVT